MKKLSLLKALLATLLLLSLPAWGSAYSFAAVNDDEVSIYYNITSSTDLTVEVTYSGSSHPTSSSNASYSDEVIVIPETVTDSDETEYTVTGIGEYAFYYCSKLTSIDIPNTITSIADHAFWYCSSLEEVVIPDNVTTLGNSFYQCTGLKNVTIGKGVTYIEGDAFGYCTALESFTFNAVNCSTAGTSSYPIFDYTTGPVTANIGEDVTNIPDYLFYECTALTNVTYNAKSCADFTSSSNAPFSSAKSSITTVTIGDEVESIPAYLFYNCSALTTVTYNAKNCTSAGTAAYPAFYGCNALATVTIGEGVETIPDYLFNGYYSGNFTNFTSVTIPASVTSIGIYAFDYCQSLSSLTFAEGSLLETIGAYAFERCTSLTTLTLPSSLTSISAYAFQNCSNLSSITIPSRVESIGTYAFYDCSSIATVTYNAKNCADFTIYTSSQPFYSAASSLTTVTIGDEVESIPTYLFCDCTALTTVTISDDSRLTSIGAYAFQNCSNLSSITIPSGVESIGTRAFYECRHLTTVIYNAVNCAVFTSSTAPFSGLSSTSSITAIIGEGVESIPAYLFYNCSKIAGSISFPTTLTSIGNRAFYGCSSLEKIENLENTGITEIPTYLFYNCSSLSGTITFPSTITSLGEYAFAGCSKLEEIEGLENTAITEIPDYAFYECNALKSIGIPASVTSISTLAFYNCTSLGTLTYNAVKCADTELYVGNTVFGRCTLTTVNIGSDVQRIPANLFRNCSAITSIEIPASVTQIGDYAFYLCSGLASVYYPSTEPAECGTEVFHGISTSRVLYVPYGYEDYYKNYSGSGDDYAWNYFTTIKAGWLPISVNAEDNDDEDDKWYATYYNREYAYTMPDDTQGTTVTVSGNTLDMTWTYTAGKTVPANTPLLLRRSDELDDFFATVVYDDETEDTDDAEEETTNDNMLHGSDEIIGATEMESITKSDDSGSDDYVYYKLTYNTDHEDLGFYWGADGGAAFDVPSENKAWLAVPQSVAAKLTGFAFGGSSIDDGENNETTGIASIESTGVSDTAGGVIYNLAGQRVNDTNRREVYIVDGKKVVKK